MSHFLTTSPIYSIARVVLEATVPLAVSSGQSNHVFDSDLVRDASGLPMIPGSATAGVLRHLYWREYGETEMQRIFGLQDGDIGGVSMVEVAAGVIHGASNTPAPAHYTSGDALLDFARATRELPVYRDRVAISERGAAKETGKFDRAILPAGFRFSVELVLHSMNAKDLAFARLLALLAHPLFRLGASTRAGLGAIRVVTIHTATLDLSTTEGAESYRTIRPDIGSTVGLAEYKIPTTKDTPLTHHALQLTPIAAWRFGPDMRPRVEQRVHWLDNEGKTEGKLGAAEIVIPASSIKGALRHRAYFYACCAAGYFAGQAADSAEQKTADAAINAIFGDASHNADGAEVGSVGNLIINDLYIPIPAPEENAIGVQQHNAIDRFSGGVRNRMLFSEELLFAIKDPIKLDVWLDKARIGDNNKIGMTAVEGALADLAAGRLALGGGASKGHGLFKGSQVTAPASQKQTGEQHAA